MANFSAVYDACVLYPAPLRDLLLQLAMTDLFRAHWSADIHKEWMRNVAADRPDIAPEQLERTRELMDAHVRDSLVEGYDRLTPSLDLPDDDDRHVLAAAIVAGADAIVTYNLKDFPKEKLNIYGIEAQHPDDFFRGDQPDPRGADSDDQRSQPALSDRLRDYQVHPYRTRYTAEQFLRGIKGAFRA